MVAGVNIVLFLIILPIVVPKLQAYFDLQTQQVDLNVSRISHGLLACGALLLTFSSSIPLLFVSECSSISVLVWLRCKYPRRMLDQASKQKGL